MTNGAEKSNQESKYFSRVLRYISEYIIPISIIPIFLGVMYGYGAINTNRIEIGHAKIDVARIDKQHNGRIMSNQIAIEKVNEKVTVIEVSIPLILQGIRDIKDDIKSIKKDVGKMENVVGVLKDRNERGNMKSGS